MINGKRESRDVRGRMGGVEGGEKEHEVASLVLRARAMGREEKESIRRKDETEKGEKEIS